MRWLTNFYDFKFKSTATVAIGIHLTKAWLSQLVSFKNAIWTWGHFRRTICNKIQYVIAIHLMRWLTDFYDFSFKETATAAIGIHPTKAWLSQLVNFKNEIWTLEERYTIKFCFKLGKNAKLWKLDLLLWPRDQETEFPVEACWLPQTQEGLTEQIHPQTFEDPFVLTALAWSTSTGFPLDRQSTRNTMLRF